MKAKGCARCNMLAAVGVDGQVFEDGELLYNVSKARAIVEANPRPPVDVPPGQAYETLLQSKIHLTHSRHVDIKYPSIVVRCKRRFVFIDGNHRAFARLCRQLPVKAYLLTPREVRAILSSK